MDLKNKMKIFVSYTTRDGIIRKEFLHKLFNNISNFCLVYIDMLHNNSVNKQKRVFKELRNSDFIFLIKTEQIDNSEWVDKEISHAKKLNIPIYEFEYEILDKGNFSPINNTINKLNLHLYN